MTRCPSRPSTLPALLLAAATWLALPPATAQPLQPATAAGQRTFPDTARRGMLLLESRTTARINGQPVRLAPGLRIFSPDNTLVFAHTLIGEKRTVNYVTEASTGMLLTAWILNPAEANRPRKGSEATDTNIRSEWDGKSSRIDQGAQR